MESPGGVGLRFGWRRPFFVFVTTASIDGTAGNRPSGCRDNRFVELFIPTLRTLARMWVSAQRRDAERHLVFLAVGVTPALL